MARRSPAVELHVLSPTPAPPRKRGTRAKTSAPTSPLWGGRVASATGWGDRSARRSPHPDAACGSCSTAPRGGGTGARRRSRDRIGSGQPVVLHRQLVQCYGRGRSVRGVGVLSGSRGRSRDGHDVVDTGVAALVGDRALAHRDGARGISRGRAPDRERAPRPPGNGRFLFVADFSGRNSFPDA